MSVAVKIWSILNCLLFQLRNTTGGSLKSAVSNIRYQVAKSLKSIVGGYLIHKLSQKAIIERKKIIDPKQLIFRLIWPIREVIIWLVSLNLLSLNRQQKIISHLLIVFCFLGCKWQINLSDAFKVSTIKEPHNANKKLTRKKQGNFQFRSPLQFLVVAKWQGIWSFCL